MASGTSDSHVRSCASPFTVSPRIDSVVHTRAPWVVTPSAGGRRMSRTLSAREWLLTAVCAALLPEGLHRRRVYSFSFACAVKAAIC